MAYTPTGTMSQMPSYWDQLAQQNMQKGAQGGGAAMTPSQLQAAITGDASAYYNNMLAQYNQNRQFGLQEQAQAFNQDIKKQEMAAAETVGNRSFYGQMAGLGIYGAMNADKIAGGLSKAYNWMTADQGIDPLLAPEGMLPPRAIGYQTPGQMYDPSNITNAAYDPGLGYGGSELGADAMMYDPMMTGMDAYQLGGGMGTLGEFGAALPGIGTAMIGTAAAGMAAVTGLNWAGNQIFGEGKQLSTYPTEELVKAYQSDQRSVPIYSELKNRGFDFAKNGLTPLTQQETAKYYMDMGQFTSGMNDMWGDSSSYFSFAT